MSEQFHDESDPEELSRDSAGPQVPVPEDFKVGKVIVLPEDMTEREKIRKEFGSSGPQARTDLTDTGMYRPAVSRGHKGRGGKLSE